MGTEKILPSAIWRSFLQRMWSEVMVEVEEEEEVGYSEDIPGRNLDGGQGRFHFRGNGREWTLHQRS